MENFIHKGGTVVSAGTNPLVAVNFILGTDRLDIAKAIAKAARGPSGGFTTVRSGWTLPLDPTKKVIHVSDINDLGKVVAGAFLQPDAVGNGGYLSLATELNSFNDILAAFKANGKDYSFTQVPGDVFSTFFEGAKELTEMFGYFEKYTYMGPNSKPRIDLAKQMANGEFLSYRSRRLKPTRSAGQCGDSPNWDCAASSPRRRR